MTRPAGHQPPLEDTARTYSPLITSGDIAEMRQAEYASLRHLAPRWHPDNPERAAELLTVDLDSLYGLLVDDSAVEEHIRKLFAKHADELEAYGVGNERPPIAPPLDPPRPLTVSDLVTPEAIERHTGLTAHTTAVLEAVEIVADLLNRQLQPAGAKLVLVAACTDCGCTDDDACFPACHWVTPSLCSSCADRAAGL